MIGSARLKPLTHDAGRHRQEENISTPFEALLLDVDGQAIELLSRSSMRFGRFLLPGNDDIGLPRPRGQQTDRRPVPSRR